MNRRVELCANAADNLTIKQQKQKQQQQRLVSMVQPDRLSSGQGGFA